MLHNKKIRNWLLVLTLAIPGSFFTTSMALGNNGFKVINQSGNEVFYLYIAESDARQWGRDLLRKDILKHQQARTFYLPRYHPCDYMIRAVFYNKDEIRKRINLCENRNVTIKTETIETN